MLPQLFDCASGKLNSYISLYHTLKIRRTNILSIENWMLPRNENFLSKRKERLSAYDSDTLILYFYFSNFQLLSGNADLPIDQSPARRNDGRSSLAETKLSS